MNKAESKRYVKREASSEKPCINESTEMKDIYVAKLAERIWKENEGQKAVAQTHCSQNQM